MCCRASSTPVRRRRITASNAPCTRQPAPPRLAPTQSGSALRRAQRTSLRVHTARGVPAGGKATLQRAPRRCTAAAALPVRRRRVRARRACAGACQQSDVRAHMQSGAPAPAARPRAPRGGRPCHPSRARDGAPKYRGRTSHIHAACRNRLSLEAPSGAGQSGAHASRACAMAPSHPSRGRQLRRLVGLLLAVLCIWALLSPGQARGAFEDAGCATVLGDDASLLGAVGQGKAAAAGLRRRGAGAPAASVAGASNGSGRSGSVRSLCAAAASLAAKPAPRPLAAVTTAVGRVCAALEAPPGAVRLGAAAPRLPVRSSHSRRVAPRPRLTRRPARHRRTTTSCRGSAPGARKPWAHTCETRSRSRC